MTLSCFNATYWNLVQTLGWIYLGNRELVEEAGQPGCRPNQMMLLIAAEEIPPRYPSLGEATEDLYEALRSGAVTAVGVLDNRGEPKPIPSTFWTHGQFFEEPEVAGPSMLMPGTSLWYGLRFLRREILQYWHDPNARPAGPDPDAAARLSFEQLAGRWLADTPGTGLKVESLSVDLVRQAEAGTFLSRPGEGEPHGPHFDPRLGKHVQTFDQDGRPTAPNLISNYVGAGRSGSEWELRLKAARDIEVDLTAVGAWLDTDSGIAWMTARGLEQPRFIPARYQPATVSTVAAEGRCTQWLSEKMSAGDPTQSKSDLKGAAVAQFRISGAGFQRCWAAAIRQSGNLNWSKSGPRKRRKASEP